MTRVVLLSGPAKRTYDGLHEQFRRRIRIALALLATTGRGDVKRLRGTRGREDLFRLRVGDYRIVYALSATEIRVTRILHRSEGYDWL